MTTPNPKCSVCKCYWMPTDTDISSAGLPFKSCKKCRDRQKEIRSKSLCEHNRRKSQCKECDGSSICEHNRRKSNCKECVGSSICEHNRRKSRCKECGGSSICEHDKIKSQCKECGGSAICEHNRFKSICRECGGSAICEHNRFKSTCKECGGSAICEHNRFKSTCKECGGSAICEHDKRKSTCKECVGSQICEHNREKSKCKECDFKLYLVNIQRRQIYKCFKSSTLQKQGHSIEYLGCKIENLIEHFNKKMEYFNQYLASDLLMTWENIHIDHIKPISRFNLDDEDEFLDCCHYSNLQPLLSKDNLEKSNKWYDTNEEFWKANIKGNDYQEIYMV